MGLAWRLHWDKQVELGVRAGLAGLRSSTQDDLDHWTDTLLHDAPTSSRVRSGPGQVELEPPWKVITLRVLPIKEGRGVGQTWLLGR